jgi:DNA-binding LytR/AlgR family response regulator
VVFLDIQMPGLNGFEVVEALSAEAMPLIVFVTAYDEYALAAFEANAVAYLLKPVLEDRLKAVVSRVEQLVRSPGEVAEAATRAGAIAGASPQTLHHVLAVQKEGYALIPLDDVCFFQVEDGVTHVKTATATYRTNYAINDLERRLPSPRFFRAHRSTIANLDKVATVSPLFKGAMLLKMKDSQGSEIQVSERQAKHLRELLQL